MVDGDVADTPWGKVPVPPGAPRGPRQLLVRPAGVRLMPAEQGLPCTVAARTFRGDHVALILQPGQGPRLEASVMLRDAPEAGVLVGVAFVVEDVVILDGEAG